MSAFIFGIFGAVLFLTHCGDHMEQNARNEVKSFSNVIRQWRCRDGMRAVQCSDMTYELHNERQMEGGYVCENGGQLKITTRSGTYFNILLDDGDEQNCLIPFAEPLHLRSRPLDEEPFWNAEFTVAPAHCASAKGRILKSDVRINGWPEMVNYPVNLSWPGFQYQYPTWPKYAASAYDKLPSACR